MIVKSLEELRIDFEGMARSCKFDISRMANGEYEHSGRNTFMLWADDGETALCPQCGVDSVLPGVGDILFLALAYERWFLRE